MDWFPETANSEVGSPAAEHFTLYKEARVHQEGALDAEPVAPAVPSSLSPHVAPPSLTPEAPSTSPQSAPTMPTFFDQPPEVLHHIFQEVEIGDLASLSLTCRHLNSLISNDELLWKLHYLDLFVSLQ